MAQWDASTCDPFEYFKAQQLILNIDLCGASSSEHILCCKFHLARGFRGG